MQNEIINVLTDIHHNKVSPALISPKQLKQQLNQIREHLKNEQMLPVTPDNILMLYKMMRAEGTIVNNHVIIKITLPLVSTQMLEIFKLSPIPSTTENGIINYEIKIPFIAINDHRDEFVELTEMETLTILYANISKRNSQPKLVAK